VSAATALRARRHRAGESATERIGWLFIVGSACFALASLPGASSLSDDAVGVVYFMGSIFFTTAALEQLRTCDWTDRGDLWSALVQFAGTLLFNVNTFDAMSDRLSTRQQDLLVWAPDAIGSVCFLIASGIALVAVWRDAFFAPARRIARLNMIGSVAFGASALAAFVLPATDELLDATIARSMTLLGALCFLWAASLLVRRG
jgi:hypothetical protein